jgi:MFS transporter, PAT family, beta-lactamase induction signal transducer AmpG
MIATAIKVFDKKTHHLPALSERSILRYFSFAALYVAQGIPEGLTYYAIPAWMAMNGKSATEIGGFIAVIGIPWSFKILVAPLMDRFTYLPMGRRRPWVIFGQLGLIISFIAMGFIKDPLNNIGLLTIAGFWVSFFGAFQDVAVDGMAIDIIPHEQQARANGIMWGSKTIGSAVSLATGTFIINAYGFVYAVCILSTAVICIMMVPVLLKERPGEKLLPWTKGETHEEAEHLHMQSWKSIFKTLIQVFFLPSSLMMGAAAFIMSMAFSVMNTMLPIFTIQGIGWTDTDYSHVMATATITGGIIGMIAGGALVDHFGKKQMLTVYGIALIFLVMAMAFQQSFWQYKLFISGFILVYYVLYTCTTIAIFATGMQLCWNRVAATQFTLYMAISNVGMALGGKLLGYLRGFLEWKEIILCFALFCIAMLIIIRFIRFESHLHKVERLEENFVHD